MRKADIPDPVSASCVWTPGPAWLSANAISFWSLIGLGLVLLGQALTLHLGIINLVCTHNPPPSPSLYACVRECSYPLAELRRPTYAKDRQSVPVNVDNATVDAVMVVIFILPSPAVRKRTQNGPQIYNPLPKCVHTKSMVPYSTDTVVTDSRPTVYCDCHEWVKEGLTSYFKMVALTEQKMCQYTTQLFNFVVPCLLWCFQFQNFLCWLCFLKN
jgi:hypothetical protein